MKDEQHSPTILLVEDETLVAISEQTVLQEEGYQVRIAPSGDTAIAAARDEAIQLVLMDIDLGPGITGGDAARRILSFRNIPIVFFTNHSDEDTIAQIRSITRYGYVLKTSGTRVLLEVIRLALELHEEHKEVERSRDLYRSIANLTGDIIVRHDADGNWVYLNDAAYKAWGIPNTDPAQLNYLDYVHPDDVEATQTAAARLRDSREPVRGLVNHVETPQGTRIYEWNSAPVIDEEGNYRGFQSTGRDITAQKENEERITELLKERSLLLHEIHHRVKNDLNLVYSLLSLQSGQVEEEAARIALQEAGQRVQAITGVYDLLIERDGKDTVPLKRLVDSLVTTQVDTSNSIRVNVAPNVAEEALPVRQSIAVGIVINELLTNAHKYAHHNGEERPTIQLDVDASPVPRSLVIRVRDNGAGFPDKIIRDKRFGFGLTVVDSLVGQHDGTIAIENDTGAVVTVTVPLEAEVADESPSGG